MKNQILTVENISKSFPGVQALDNVQFNLNHGEVHALVGENGAGKSTLMKVITGVIEPDSGTIQFEGNIHRRFEIAESRSIGIRMIYQELNLIPNLTIGENIFFGSEPRRGGLVDFKKINEETGIILKKLGVSLDPGILVKDLSVAFQQIVEIAKAISTKLKVLIMDEPTAPLTSDEVRVLFKLVHTLREQGVSIIYISHRLEEIFEICNRVTVFRDGRYIDTLQVDVTNKNELIKLMVGRDIENQYPDKVQVKRGNNPVLEVKKLSNKHLKAIDIALFEGEIVGIGGLVGSGRTELLRALFGADMIDEGEIWKDGRKLFILNPEDAIECGIVLIPENRKAQGLQLKMSVQDNIIFASLHQLKNRFSFLDFKKIREKISGFIQKLRIKTPSAKQPVKNLSGGNQQKVVIAKWLLTNADIVMFDEPTRGIDVGAKYEIYTLMNSLKAEGKSIIMVTSEMPELLGMSDRIYVMCEGRISGELTGVDIDQEKVMHFAADFELKL